MVSNGRVARGNTSDLVGLWNSRAVETDNESTNRFLSISPRSKSPNNQFKFRKTSAQETSTKVVVEPQYRKTSAFVLMPKSSDLNNNNTNNDLPKSRSTLAIDLTDSCSSYKPRKTSAMASLGPGSTVPLKSSLKSSCNSLSPDYESRASIPTVVTSPPPGCDVTRPRFNEGRRGSNLGRSKSVKCHRVKFGPEFHSEIEGATNSGLLNRTQSARTKNESPFDKFRKMENESQDQASILPGRLQRQASLPSVNRPQVGIATAPAAQQEGKSPALGRSVMARSPSSTKDLMLMWVQQRTNTYPNLNVTNFSSCWNDGLAFCALIHYYYPEAFEFEKLESKNRRYNFTLAFESAEKYAGIAPLLDVEDMVMMIKPDWKCVFTYVQSFYRRFRNGRDPPPPTKTLILTKHDDDN